MFNRSFLRKSLGAAVFCLVCSTATPAAETTVGALTEDAARKQAAGMLEGGRVIRAKTVRKGNGSIVHRYLVINDDARAKVTIDGDNGELLKFAKKSIKSVDLPRGMQGGEPRDTKLSMDDAKKIAIERAGGGEVVKIEKEFKKRGNVVYDVEVVNGGMEYEMEIDADTGAILEYKVEAFDDDDWSDD